MRAVRALGRFGWLLAAVAVPFAVVVLGVGIQAAAFRRPPRDALVASDAVSELLSYRVMRATEVIGRERLGATCVQGWFRTPHHSRTTPGALVLLSNGVKLYDLGKGVRRFGHAGLASKRDRARFLLAGCPRYFGDHVGSLLVGNRWVEIDPSSADDAPALELSFGVPTRPIELFLAPRTYRPIALRLAGVRVRGWSDLSPGGGAALVKRVGRAFPFRMVARNGA
jgi:hypothetical protein